MLNWKWSKWLSVLKEFGLTQKPPISKGRHEAASSQQIFVHRRPSSLDFLLRWYRDPLDTAKLFGILGTKVEKDNDINKFSSMIARFLDKQDRYQLLGLRELYFDI